MLKENIECDQPIQSLGEEWCIQTEVNKIRWKNYTAARMRIMARLLPEMDKLIENELSPFECIQSREIRNICTSRNQFN